MPFEAEPGSGSSALEDALGTAGALAEVAGTLKEQSERDVSTVAYIYLEQEWHLAWWVVSDGVYVTREFAEQAPDPKGFLSDGDGEQGASAQG